MEVVRRCCFQMAVCHRKFMGATSAVSYMFACSTTTDLSCQYMFLRIDQLDTPWHCLQSCLPYVRGAPRWLGLSCGIWPHKKVWVLIVIGDLVSLWPAKSRWSRVPRGERMAMLDHVSRCQGGKNNCEVFIHNTMGPHALVLRDPIDCSLQVDDILWL